MVMSSETNTHIETLFLQHKPALMRYSLSITREQGSAEDVVQTMMLKLCEQDFESIKDHVVPWMFKVCHNTAIKVLNKQKRYVAIDDDELDNRPSKSVSPDTSMSHAEQISQLRSAITHLPARYQTILNMRYHDNMSYEEIALVTKTTAGNVGFILNKCKERLQKLLKETSYN